jgi:hypothetical protein
LVWGLGQQILARLVISGFYSAYGVVGSFLAVLFFGAEFVRVLGVRAETNSGASGGRD